MTQTQQFDIKSTASEIASAYSDRIKGRTVLITGVSPAGLGSETALAVAKGGASLIIVASRTRSNAEQVIASVQKEVPGVTLRFVELDLNSLASVRKAASEVLGYKEPLHVIINNAAMMGPYRRTVDGYESQFSANHLGHFVLTNTLLPKLIETAKKDPSFKPRVVNVSSNAHVISNVLYDDPNFDDGKTYDKWVAYGQSKTANIQYTVALADRLAKHNILAYSLHPGVIHTNALRDFNADEIKELGFFNDDGSKKDVVEHDVFGTLVIKTLAQGAATHIYAAFSPEIESRPGAFLEDSHISDAVKDYALDKENANKLWTLSEKLAGETYAF